MVYQNNFTEVKYLSISILKMLQRFSKIMTTIEDKSRPAAFVPYVFQVGYIHIRINCVATFVRAPACDRVKGCLYMRRRGSLPNADIWWHRGRGFYQMLTIDESKMAIFKMFFFVYSGIPRVVLYIFDILCVNLSFVI